MMNLLALSLVTTSLVVSGLFSPNPQKQEQVILKEGHRSVIVEYDDDVKVGNTKVKISPREPSKGPGSGPVEEGISRAAASVAGVAQEVIPGVSAVHGVRPREMICDAYGRCKHKIAGVWEKAKGKAADAEEAVEEAVGIAKESAEGVRRNAKEKVREAGEAAERTGDLAREKVGKMKGKTEDMVEETGEYAREKVDKMKGKTGEIGGKAKDRMEKMKGKTEEMAEETGEMIKEKGKRGKKEIGDIAKRGKDVILDTIWYVVAIGYFLSKETLNSILSVTHLLGFATAYGISIWVTFIMSNVLARVLGRQQFGMVQSKVYPVYFKTMVGSIGLALVGHLMGHRGYVFRSKGDMLQGYNLMTSLLLVLGNLLFLEPRATKTMFNRMKLEKEEGRGRDKDHISSPTKVMDSVFDHTTTLGSTPTDTVTTTAVTTEPTTTTTTASKKVEEEEAKTKLGKLDERLKKLNSYSSLLNVMSLMGLTWHLVYLSQRLQANAC